MSNSVEMLSHKWRGRAIGSIQMKPIVMRYITRDNTGIKCHLYFSHECNDAPYQVHKHPQ